MKSHHRSLYVVLGLLLFTFSAQADTLVLKDGNVLQGTFTGGTAEAIQFDVNGKVQSVALSEITSLTFSLREAKAATAVQQAPVAVAAVPAATVSGSGTVPAGTKVMIKMKDAITTASHKKGSKFSAVLETDLAANGVVIAPKGTLVYGTVLESRGGRALGTSRLLVTFTDLSINNQLIPIVTDDFGAESQPGKAAKTVGAAALIGAAAGDAGKGAAVGGAVALLGSRGNHIQVPAGTMVDVTLKQPVTVP